MGKVTVEFGIFLGECGHCHGSFVYTVDRKDADRPKDGRCRTYLVGKCPLCEAPIRQRVDVK